MTNKSGVVPTGYRLLVRPIVVEEKTAGGIIIPDEAKDQKQWRQSRGEVVSIGELAFSTGTPGTDGHYRWKTRPDVGSVIRFREYAGLNWEDDSGQRWTLLDDSDVVAIEIEDE